MDIITKTKHYIQNKDIFEKSIIDIKEEENRIIVRKNKSKEIYLLANDLDLKKLEIEDEFEKIWLLFTDEEKNLKKVIQEWNSLIKISEIRLMFMNIKTSGKWLINPKTHSKIVGDKNLEKSLRSIRNNS